MPKTDNPNLPKPRQLIARVMITHGDKLLMIRRSETSGRAGMWELPGGSVETDESFEEAVRREAREETKLVLSDIVYSHSESYDVDGKPRMASIFKANVENTAVTLSNKHDDFKWVNASNYHNLKLEDHYREFLDDYFSPDEQLIKNAEKDTTNTNIRSRVTVYTDGGSRGNPGPSATGYVIMDEQKQILMEGGEYLGITTNNQAEYQAVRTALEKCIELGANEADFFIDSQLVVKQMNGEYKIKNRDLWPIHENIKQLAARLKQVTYTHVYREDNKLADAKVNEVLDNH